MDVVSVIEGLISSVPQAGALWNMVAPLIMPKAGITEAEMAAINALVPEVHAAVDVAHAAIAQLITSHDVKSPVAPPAPPAAPTTPGAAA